jgi:hypothetical protein
LSSLSDLYTGEDVSWEAVAWANRQKLKKSYEQIVLLVLANCADPNGEAFAKWPGREHWWVYLSERTRLPKSSLFRHLNTLMALGLGDRSMQVLADGSRRPTFKLNMEACFDIDVPEDAARYLSASSRTSAENQSPVGTEHEGDADGGENDSDFSTSETEETTITRQSPGGTGASCAASPSTGTEPFPVLGLQKDSILLSKDSPLPPSGGAVRDELFDQFVKAWREPIPKMALARSAWDHIATVKRSEVVAAATGYFAWLAKHPKPPAAVSAQSFLRDEVGWAQWLRYVPDANGVVPPLTSSFPLGSDEGKAIVTLYEMAGLRDLLDRAMIRSGVVNYLLPMTPRLKAMAQAPGRAEWEPLTRQQAGAWEGFLRDAVTVPSRKRLREGDRAPWGWPPTVDGQVYAKGSDPPPDQLMRDEDFDNI